MLKTAKKKDIFGVKKKINLKFGVYLLISDFFSSNSQSQQKLPKTQKASLILQTMGVLRHFAPWDIFWSRGIEKF